MSVGEIAAPTKCKEVSKQRNLICKNHLLCKNQKIELGSLASGAVGLIFIVLIIILIPIVFGAPAFSQTAALPDSDATSQPSSSPSSPSQQQLGGPASVPPQAIGVSFVEGSSSQVMVERDGKKYVVDLATKQVREVSSVTEAAANTSSSSSQTPPAQNVAKQDQQPSGATAQKSAVYHPGDDLVFNVPTGRRIDRHGLYLNFTHRFPFEAAFTGPGRGDTLLGLDDFAIPSFGLRYGVTSKLSVFAYRSPSIIGRPIELMAAYNFLDERDGNPLNAAFRFSVDGQNDFSSNFAENLELVVSRSLGRRAQVYAVPTYSIHARPVISDPNGSLAEHMPDQPCSAALAVGLSPAFNARPCADTFSLATAISVDIRPTVALIAEATPTLVNGRDLGIHRPEYAFGIQKKIWRHAFTLGFSNGPGSIVSQRGGTRATFLNDPTADKPGGLFIGFDLTRQIF
jgi:Membrane bound beta barrel domain (DUF5777)